MSAAEVLEISEEWREALDGKSSSDFNQITGLLFLLSLWLFIGYAVYRTPLALHLATRTAPVAAVPNVMPTFDRISKTLTGDPNAFPHLKNLQVGQSGATITVAFGVGQVFRAGSDTIEPRSLDDVQKMIDRLSTAAPHYYFQVAGYTDSGLVKHHKNLFPTNWHLSADRAATILILLENKIPLDHLRVIGYGKSRPKVQDVDADGRLIKDKALKNRRVVISLSPSEKYLD